jgi:hypothetical protein
MVKPRFQCPLDKRKTDRLFRLALILVNIVLLIALTTYAVRGFYSRYWADDYCFGTIFHQHGLWEGTGFFYRNTSNRFAAYFLVGLNELLGERAIRLSPCLHDPGHGFDLFCGFQPGFPFGEISAKMGSFDLIEPVDDLFYVADGS